MIKQMKVELREDATSNPFIFSVFKRNVELCRGSILSIDGKIAYVAIPGHMVTPLGETPEVANYTVISGREKGTRDNMRNPTSKQTTVAKSNSVSIPKPLCYGIGGAIMLTVVYFLGRSHGKG